VAGRIKFQSSKGNQRELLAFDTPWCQQDHLQCGGHFQYTNNSPTGGLFGFFPDKHDLIFVAEFASYEICSAKAAAHLRMIGLLKSAAATPGY
jgi:hypothetical protein